MTYQLNVHQNSNCWKRPRSLYEAAQLGSTTYLYCCAFIRENLCASVANCIHLFAVQEAKMTRPQINTDLHG